jgi:hypothetical protein
MGTALVWNDTFIFGLDFIWARVGTGVTFKDPGSPLSGVGADLKLSSIVTTAAGGLRIPVGPLNLSLYGIVGARYFHDRTSITLTGPVFGFFPLYIRRQRLGRSRRRVLRTLSHR